MDKTEFTAYLKILGFMTDRVPKPVPNPALNGTLFETYILLVDPLLPEITPLPEIKRMMIYVGIAVQGPFSMHHDVFIARFPIARIMVDRAHPMDYSPLRYDDFDMALKYINRCITGEDAWDGD
jgi:hypothetical protein